MMDIARYTWTLAFVLMAIRVCECKRCLNCKGSPLPHECLHVTDCTDGENCYVEQLITSSGHVVYNSGCRSKQRCGVGQTSGVGRRDLEIRRSTDIVTCEECCDGNICNNHGCGQTAVPRVQRGPYCYSCDVSSPSQPCSDLIVCDTSKVCGLYAEHEFSGLPELVYKSSCMSKQVCNAIHRASAASGNTRCIPTCCETDFCNTKCNGTSV